jgi:hypothetical protein
MREWTLTNGTHEIELCRVCRQPRYEGHVDCSCDKNHSERCFRPTYSELEAKLENARRISGDNADLALRYRNLLQALLDRSNSGGDIRLLTILSLRDVAEIETALEA